MNNVVETFEKMAELGILKHIGLKDDMDFSYLRFCEGYNITPYEKLGILCRYNEMDIEKLSDRWKLSNVNKKILKRICSIEIGDDFLTHKNKYRYLYHDVYEVLLVCWMIEEEDRRFQEMIKKVEAEFKKCSQTSEE